MSHRLLKLLVFCSMIFMLFSGQVFAKRFASQYCEFELPPGWECSLEGSEWVCQSLNKERKKEAIIILAAKIRGSSDDLDKYQAYLKKTKTFKLPGGKMQASEPKYAKVSTINQHRWVDALHLASEVPGFYTRYVATVKEDLGVAVTLSVAKDHYATYQGIFDKIVASLRVFRQKHAATGTFKLKSKEEDLLGDATFIPDAGSKDDIGLQKKRKKRKGGGPLEDYLLYIIGGVVVLFFLMKGKGKKKKKKKK